MDEDIMASVNQELAGRYASALFDLADEGKALDQVSADLATIKGLFDESPELGQLARSPLVKAEDRARAFGAVMDKAGVSTLVANFAQVVAKNGRLFALPQIIKAFNDELSRRRGEIVAEVRVAAPLSAEQEARLLENLQAKHGKGVKLDVQIDASIIGGMTIRVGSVQIDSSLATKLNKLSMALKSGVTGAAA
jgi:F-type H+-transporting ATPase subunit delta